jgi:hypothetical protein
MIEDCFDNGSGVTRRKREIAEEDERGTGSNENRTPKQQPFVVFVAVAADRSLLARSIDRLQAQR